MPHLHRGAIRTACDPAGDPKGRPYRRRIRWGSRGSGGEFNRRILSPGSSEVRVHQCCGGDVMTEPSANQGGEEVVVDDYNLDTIISVDYRVKSAQGPRFCQWATGPLREHLLRGYTRASVDSETVVSARLSRRSDCLLARSKPTPWCQTRAAPSAFRSVVNATGRDRREAANRSGPITALERIAPARIPPRSLGRSTPPPDPERSPAQ